MIDIKEVQEVLFSHQLSTTSQEVDPVYIAEIIAESCLTSSSQSEANSKAKNMFNQRYCKRMPAGLIKQEI
jgi:hypothetical protein